MPLSDVPPRKPLSDPAKVANTIPELRFLKLVVGGLAVVMALGIAVIVAILWLRLTPTAPTLPQDLALPAGAVPAAVTMASDWTVVLTQAGDVLVYDRAGTLRQQVALPRD